MNRWNEEAGMEIIIVGAADVLDLAHIVYGEVGGKVIGYCGLNEIEISRYADFAYLGADLHEAHVKHPNAVFLLALSSNERRKALSHQVLEFGGTLLSAIHPQTVIFPSAKLGQGVIIQPGSVISALATVGDGVYINYAVLVGHDVSVGAFSFLAPGVRLLGEGNIGKGVFIGCNAVIHPQVKIGDGAKIAAGAQVHRDVPAGVTLMVEQKLRMLKEVT
jgi:sugar O-acyltransferase (sialic acid O-acetyltransferase NeuD family)